MKTISKIAAIALVAVALVGVNSASAATVAELQAMIASLSAQIAALSGTPSTPAGVTFTSNLTMGSTGAEVTALQNFLIGKGFSIPAGATGYFGGQTKAALAAYQTSKGITPAVGYFGPLTRTSVNGEAPVVVTPGTTPTTGTGISTPGKEGTLTATVSNVGLKSTVYEGDSMVAVLGAKVEAKDSDIAIQRVKLDLGDSTRVYNKIFSKVYVTEGSNVLASADLNSSTVTKGSDSRYYITITGMNLVVSKDTTKNIVIKFDVKDSIESTDRNNQSTSPIRFAVSGIRGVDGAGIDQLSPVAATDISRTVTVSQDLAETATITLSTNSATAEVAEIIASEGSGDNEKDGVTLASFDLKAEKGEVLVTDIAVSLATSTGAATLSTVYLYDGSTELDSATMVAGVAKFSDVDITVAKDATKTLTVKADVRGAVAAKTTWSVTGVNITSENSKGDSITEGGSVVGKAISFRNAGPQLSLTSKSLGTKTSVTVSGGDVASSTQDFVFKLNVKAVGGAVTLGSSASTTPAFGTSTSYVNIYKGSATTTGALTVSYFEPSSGVTTSNNTYTIAEGQNADFDVTYSLTVGTSSAGSYSLGLAGVNTNGVSTDFMNGLSAWRTSAVQLP